MIKVDVGFDGDVILINGHSVFVNWDDCGWWIEIDEVKHYGINLEEAITYCLEQKHD